MKIKFDTHKVYIGEIICGGLFMIDGHVFFKTADKINDIVTCVDLQTGELHLFPESLLCIPVDGEMTISWRE